MHRTLKGKSRDELSQGQGDERVSFMRTKGRESRVCGRTASAEVKVKKHSETMHKHKNRTISQHGHIQCKRRKGCKVPFATWVEA